ncbi:hypothetical protein IFM89_015184 [Coptis chinensis]|uniref:Uncharacterized protein n=1 Tax=Coptis chinensis TaxID=261450 RepID=A0A835HCX3_9MAGN|nr:hypothetical protein IFM89_015184 [Coptis chinensis]
MVSSMTWFSDITNRVGIGITNITHHKRSNSNHNNHHHEPVPIFGILAFEAARSMSRLVSLYKSVSEDQIHKLRNVTMRSQGVAYLNSMDEDFLLKLACAERIEDLDRSAISVARFGKKCSDHGLTQFEFTYADLKLGFIDLAKLDFASKEIEKSIVKMEKFISATSSLYAAFESLSEMEALERTTKRWKDHSGPIPKQNPKLEFSEQKLLLLRKEVQHLQEISLWNQTFDKMVGFMARTVCIVYAQICVVFAPHISVLPTVSSRHVRFSSSLIHFKPRDAQDQEPVKKEIVTSRSGPIPKRPQTKQAETGFIRFRSKDTKPLPGENIGFRIGIKENHEYGFGWVEKTTRLFQQAPRTTVGGSGLALRYANVIMLLDKHLESPSSLTDCERDDLYEMLPECLKVSVNFKLRKLYRNQDESEWWVDGTLAQGWKDGLRVIMGWFIAYGT